MAGGSLRDLAASFRLAFAFAFAFCAVVTSFALGNANARAAATSAAIVSTPAPPTSIASSADGALLFIGLDHHFGDAGGIVVYRRDARAGFVRIGAGHVQAGVDGVALSPDAATLVFTTRDGPGIVAVAALVSGRDVPLAAERDGKLAGSNQIVISANGRYAFYTNQRDASLGVARIATDAAGVRTLDIVAHVGLDRLPGGIALSPDGSLLYVTSEIDNVDPARVAGADDPKLGRKKCEVNLGPQGVLSVIDTVRAVADPAHAVRARVAAACAPVRVALSPSGDIAWVSARGEDRALAFATTKLLDDPAHALLARLDVGRDPIGILATRDGRHVAVVASDGEAAPHAQRHAGVAVFDAAGAARGDATSRANVEAGSRPREIRESGDGTIWVTDYFGRAVRALETL